MKTTLMIWSLLLVLATPGFSQLPSGSPESVAMNAKILDAGASLFEDAVAKEQIRGAVILVARRGVVVMHRSIGWRDLAKKKPMAKDSLFRMASNTKPVVATAILMLAEKGHLKLSDPVSQYLKSFDHAKGREITIAQLLSHTSGLRIKPLFFKPLSEPSKDFPGAPNLQAEVARFGRIGFSKKPGTSYKYSNAGFNTLGAIIEVVSKMQLAAFLERYIYKPLGMNDSCNHESTADRTRMSAIFRQQKKGGFKVGWTPKDEPDYPFVRASGGMVSTAMDYAIFCQMYLDKGTKGKTRILSEESIASAIMPHTRKIYTRSQRQERLVFYGLGWVVSKTGVYSHSGSDGTYAWVDPKRKIIGLVLTQSPKCPNPRRQFRRVVEAACQP